MPSPHLALPISSGIYRTHSGAIVQIYETGSFAYGRNPNSGEEDFWYFDSGKYTRRPAKVGAAHPLDLVDRVPQIGDVAK